jgi:hypothetical protein
MAILLKTMLVRVSSIQNTQIRGKTIAKGFGKVDTLASSRSSDRSGSSLLPMS